MLRYDSFDNGILSSIWSKRKLLSPPVPYWDVLSSIGTYCHLLGRTVTYWDVLSPTGTYCHLLSPTFIGSFGNLEILGKWLNLTSKSFLTLLAGEEEEEETVEPDMMRPPWAMGA